MCIRDRGKPQDTTSQGIHVRYTTKDDALYAILFKWPTKNPVFPNLRATDDTTIRMLGIEAPTIPWEQTDAGLVVSLPPQDIYSGKQPDVPCDHAYVYKISPIPSWFPAQPAEDGQVKTDASVARHVVTLQNGHYGYNLQTNEQLTTGQWGGDLGYSSHGGDELFLFDNASEDRHARVLVRFDLTDHLPPGATVTRAVLQLYASYGHGGFNTLEGCAALQPWSDGETCWQRWGSGGSEPGFASQSVALRGKVDGRGSHHFFLDRDLVQTWIDDSPSNHGLLLKTIAGDNNFHWNAHGDQGAHPPRLAIEYKLKH